MPQDRPASATPLEPSDATAFVLSFSFPVVRQTEVDHDGLYTVGYAAKAVSRMVRARTEPGAHAWWLT
jgi:hypothetical protein